MMLWVLRLSTDAEFAPLWLRARIALSTRRDAHLAAGDAKHGSTLVVNSLADGLACAKEVAADLLK